MSPGRPPLDLSLYLVTDASLCAQLGVVGTVVAAVSAGVSLVQLRDDTLTDDEFIRLGRQVVHALGRTNVPLIINDRVHLVRAIGAQGAHVGQGDLEVTQARTLLGPSAYLGLSVQTVEHVLRARELGVELVDYLGVGPVWATSTKDDAAAPLGPTLLGRIVSVSPWPCVAIGGLSVERLAAVRRSGALGAAVISAICGQSDVGVATRTLRSAWNSAHF